MPAPSGHFRAGKISRVSCNGQNLTYSEWSASYQGLDLDVTNFESNGYDEGIIGVLSLTWSVSGNWNAAQNPNLNPPGLLPTDAGVNLNLIVNTSDVGATYAMPSYRCFQGDAKTTATGAVTFSANGKNQGIFTVPTANN